MEKKKYPRVLIVALGRINAMDNYNNGLLLRNLFEKWPRETLAQIYSSGDNGDAGFFGRYYRLGPSDRFLGKLFYRLKFKVLPEYLGESASFSLPDRHRSKSLLNIIGKKLLYDTGLYELIFRPRISREMEKWMRDFQPNVIFAQGYNLAFTWLPLMLSKRFNLPIVYYPTDDWPSDLYHPKRKVGIRAGMHWLVRHLSQHLVESSRLRIAISTLMQSEYKNRYRRDFVVLMHGDRRERFNNAKARRLYPDDVFWIVSTGVFNSQRLPLLSDLDQACKILRGRGFKVSATIFAVNYHNKVWPAFHYADVRPCPSHEQLPAFLKGADVLFLPERFDESAKDIKLSISSKAHLFMFSERPIVVYTDPRTGIAQYASQEGWGEVVVVRDPSVLASTFARIFTNEDEAYALVSKCRQTIDKYHNIETIQNNFLKLMEKLIG